jgi:hypothetical protein
LWLEAWLQRSGVLLRRGGAASSGSRRHCGSNEPHQELPVHISALLALFDEQGAQPVYGVAQAGFEIVELVRRQVGE